MGSTAHFDIRTVPVYGRSGRPRAILHSDCNSFYASVEQCEHPELRGKPIVVAGREDTRHGIVLTKSQEAKRFGIKTAETLWQARQKCPELIVVPPDYRLYMKYSRMAHDVYYQYTSQVEPFGLDECWLDVTKSLPLFANDANFIAREISERMKAELGITVSIGISWNKVFAKFGSDYEKPDAITCIDGQNYRNVVWSSPVEDLIYIGEATKRKLNALGIKTLDQLAKTEDRLLKRVLGVIGPMLASFARGKDISPVREFCPEADDTPRLVKSYGNGLTAPHDIQNRPEARALIMLLSESVSQRMREDHCCARCVSIGVRWSKDLISYTRQTSLTRPTSLTRDVFNAAWGLLVKNEPLDCSRAIRALHVRVSCLSPEQSQRQLDLFGDEQKRLELLQLDQAIDALRSRFGNGCVKRASSLLDTSYDKVDIKRDNVIHPIGFLGQ